VGGGFSCGGGGSGGGSGSESETQSQGDDDQDEGPGGIRPAPVDAKNGQTQAEAGRQSEIDWKTRAKQAAQQAKACGKLPGSLRHMVDSLTDHSINWQEELRNFLVDVIAKDYSWRLPNKRYISSGAYLPSISYGYDLAKAMCYLDASGSVMYDADVPRRFAAEMTSLLEEFQNIELTCRYFDTRVQDHTLTFGGSDLPVKFELYNIGGGTDFRPIFKDIKNFEEPKFLIIFTDLEVSSSDYPKVQPDFPVLWCCTTDLVAPWGKTIRIK
jgi:predicted metal-dependent peptidase